MRQTTLPEQTAKLIKLGFEKPKNRIVKRRFDRSTSSWIVVGEKSDYSIGELIEMLGGVSELEITRFGSGWEVGDDFRFCTNEELIDALYDMIIMIKEEGII